MNDAAPGALLRQQGERLQARAEAVGSWLHYAAWLHALGDHSALAELAARTPEASPAERLGLSFLAAGTLPAGWRACEDGFRPWLALRMAQGLLAQRDLVALNDLVAHQLTHGQADFHLLLFAARVFAAAGAEEGLQAYCDALLEMAPEQEDVVALRADRSAAPRTLPQAVHGAVSVYVPAYNAAATLAATLDAILGQSVPLAELLVVDDGSSDATAEIAQATGVTVLRHAHNLGLAAARDSAFTALDTPLVAAFDADVQPEPAWLAEALAALSVAPPRCAGIGGRLHEMHQDGPADHWRAVHLPQDCGPARRYPMPFVAGANTLYWRGAVLAVGGHDRTCRTNSEDVVLGRALAQRGQTVAYAPAAVAWHARRDTPESVLRTFWNWSLREREDRGLLGDAAAVRAQIDAFAAQAAELEAQDLAADRPDLVEIDRLFAPKMAEFARAYAAARGWSL